MSLNQEEPIHIILPPDIANALTEEARRQGTTPEVLALDSLRKRFVPSAPTESPPQEQRTLADFLFGYIGVLSSAEHVHGGAQMSESSGKKFATGLLNKRRQGRL
ncbi:MAG TPA: hypothetical protein VNO70_10710 [Blastocatellia bacterium]|nr:hypothetical protein [Blastocatellia bacterium]